MDPFGSQQTPTDPFGSSDPFGFGDDPFASAASKSDSTSGGDQINPFQSNSSSNNNGSANTGTATSREEIVVPEPLPKVGEGWKEGGEREERKIEVGMESGRSGESEGGR